MNLIGLILLASSFSVGAIDVPRDDRPRISNVEIVAGQPFGVGKVTFEPEGVSDPFSFTPDGASIVYNATILKADTTGGEIRIAPNDGHRRGVVHGAAAVAFRGCRVRGDRPAKNLRGSAARARRLPGT